MSINFQNIVNETQNDQECQMILHALQTGKSLKQCGHNDNEFTFQDGCILKGIRVMIPNTLRDTVRNEVHVAISVLSK